MDGKTLWKKSAARAAKAPGNVISGAVSLAASAVMWNPLPLILWGLGSTGWVLFASTDESYHKKILEEEKSAKRRQTEAERAAMVQKVEALLLEPPVVGWIRRGLLPDYIQVYRRLVEIRDRVGRVLHERSEVEPLTESGILQQLDYMLGTYLQFVRERIGYLQILSHIRPGGGEVPAAPAAARGASAAPPPPPPPGFAPQRWERVNVKKSSRSDAQETGPAAPPNVEQRLAEVDAKIQRLRDLAEKEPATARTREWHIGILEKQRELLLECQKRDQCVVAQLGAFPDVFQVILGRVSAAQFSATEIASYMGSVVEQIEETERFVASMRPAMDQLMGDMGADLSRWPAST